MSIGENIWPFWTGISPGNFTLKYYLRNLLYKVGQKKFKGKLLAKYLSENGPNFYTRVYFYQIT